MPKGVEKLFKTSATQLITPRRPSAPKSDAGSSFEDALKQVRPNPKPDQPTRADAPQKPTKKAQPTDQSEATDETTDSATQTDDATKTDTKPADDSTTTATDDADNSKETTEATDKKKTDKVQDEPDPSELPAQQQAVVAQNNPAPVTTDGNATTETTDEAQSDACDNASSPVAQSTDELAVAKTNVDRPSKPTTETGLKRPVRAKGNVVQKLPGKDAQAGDQADDSDASDAQADAAAVDSPQGNVQQQVQTQQLKDPKAQDDAADIQVAGADQTPDAPAKKPAVALKAPKEAEHAAKEVDPAAAAVVATNAPSSKPDTDTPAQFAASAVHALDAVAPKTTTPTSAPQPTANAPTPQSAHNDADFVASNHDRIVTSVRTQLLPNGGTMRLRLDPPELGVMQVTVRMTDGAMNASFETSSDQATRMLSHSLSQLKTALETQGVSVEKLQVQQSPRDQQTGTSSDDQQQRGSQQDTASHREQERRELLQRMWQRLRLGSDPLDMVA